MLQRPADHQPRAFGGPLPSPAAPLHRHSPYWVPQSSSVTSPRPPRCLVTAHRPPSASTPAAFASRAPWRLRMPLGTSGSRCGSAAAGGVGGSAGPQEPAQHEGTHPVCHPFRRGGSGPAEIAALMRGALGRPYVCLVLSPAGWAATMTRGSSASQPRGRISRGPVPSAPDNELSAGWRRLCLHPDLARGTRGPSGRSNRKFSRERKGCSCLTVQTFIATLSLADLGGRCWSQDTKILPWLPCK